MIRKILNRWTDAVIWEGEAETVKDAIHAAYAADADLRGADLRDADLRDADLRDANSILSTRGNERTILPTGYEVTSSGLIVRK